MASEHHALDQARWSKLWSRLGARGDGLAVFEQLVVAYAEPHRAYHNSTHITDCLAELDRCLDLARQPDQIEAALWFHDAVYQPVRSDNEDRSARLASESLGRAGVAPSRCQRVAELILATRHLSISEDPDIRLLCDIDLAILGRDAEVFDEFERRIRSEYAWVPTPVYRASRSKVLAGFLARTAIYQTPRLADRYERLARQNLQRALGMLER